MIKVSTTSTTTTEHIKTNKKWMKTFRSGLALSLSFCRIGRSAHPKGFFAAGIGIFVSVRLQVVDTMELGMNLAG